MGVISGVLIARIVSEYLLSPACICIFRKQIAPSSVSSLFRWALLVLVLMLMLAET